MRKNKNKIRKKWGKRGGGMGKNKEKMAINWGKKDLNIRKKWE